MLLFFLLLSFKLYAQEFNSLTLLDGQIKGITYIKEGTEKTSRPVIWVHGILETSHRWKEFMKDLPEQNHYAVNLPLHGIGENITRLNGLNNYKTFYELVLPTIIEHVISSTGQQPLLVGYSLGARVIHDTLVKSPAISKNIHGVVELMRPTQLSKSIPFTKIPFRLPKPYLGFMQYLPTLPDILLMRKASALFLPAFPAGVYTHLEGTSMLQVEKYLVESHSTQIGNELNSDLIDDVNLEFSHTDHGIPTWFVWADNDLICPGGAYAFDEMVRMRAEAFVPKSLTGNKREEKIYEVIHQVLKRNFPPGFAPLYGTSMGAIGHVGGVIPGSQSAKLIGKGIQDMAYTPLHFSVPATVKFNLSTKNSMLHIFDSWLGN
ncbi:MAG TPA: hypothetical protein VNJ08_14580 [Bacteriovoracaceae bacterium]|nr:hypothetical protein [Bacteriovoracaceae bacterium]